MAFAAVPARAQDMLRGVALVIGNGDYEHLPALDNPGSDARAIEELLSDLGFETELSSDRDARRLARDLEYFAEDAEGADVAILYYAGHGIEAGGENYLVPVDADISALEDASDGLVPLSAILAQLRDSVAVTIVLLDACRDNPFPPGSVLKASPGADPVTVAASGLALAQTRGATALAPRAAAPPDDRSLGTVIGFAAEPGRVALDGDGDNSPYAAAILRHLTALPGAEFGQVMRMVAEEVYLKTDGRQRPWVNESLRRLLYFGEPAPPADGAEGEILNERRRLLLTIAELPDIQRVRAENLAASGNVPMSVVYAMLGAAGIDAGDDPDTIETRLRAEIQRFAADRAQRRALTDPDPEIRRLALLAEQAVLEGALNAADAFHEQAKQRVSAMRGTRDAQVEALRQRIVEDADVFARSAETRKLMFRHADAARDFAEARAIVADWDPETAARYLRDELDAWLIDAELNGSAASLDMAERAARAALDDASRSTGADAARTRHLLARALMLRSSRSADAAVLAEALGLLEAAAAAPGLADTDRFAIAVDTGKARGQLGLFGSDATMLAQAEAEFADAYDIAVALGDPALQADALFRRIQAIYFAWTFAPDADAMARLQAHLETLTTLLSDDGDEFSARYLGKATHITTDFAARINTPEALQLAAEINAGSADIFDPERFPLIAADIASVGVRIALEEAQRFGDTTHLGEALERQRSVVNTFSLAGMDVARVGAEWQLGLVLAELGLRETETTRLEEARALFDRLRADRSAAANDAMVQTFAYQSGRMSAEIGLRTADAALLAEAVEDISAARAALRTVAEPWSWARMSETLGNAQGRLGGATGDIDQLRDGTQLLEEVLASYRQFGADRSNPVPYLLVYSNYADISASLALATLEPVDLEAGFDASAAVHELFKPYDHTHGMALAANTAAYLAANRLREEFDPELLARAEEFADAALASVDELPDLTGYFQNTACELRTEKARHEADAAMAQSALELCQSAFGHLDGGQDTQAARTAGESVARARALVDELSR